MIHGIDRQRIADGFRRPRQLDGLGGTGWCSYWSGRGRYRRAGALPVRLAAGLVKGEGFAVDASVSVSTTGPLHSECLRQGETLDEVCVGPRADIPLPRNGPNLDACPISSWSPPRR
jgi:hypothetical protein